jgi:hypothetical protein
MRTAHAFRIFSFAVVALVLAGVPSSSDAESDSVMKEIREEMKGIRAEIRDLTTKKNEADRKGRFGKPPKDWKPAGAGSCNCATICDQDAIARARWGSATAPAAAAWKTQVAGLDSRAYCEDIIAGFGGASNLSSMTMIPTTCRNELMGCDSVKQSLFREEMLNEAENYQSMIEGKRAELKDLETRIRDERRERAREYERCPECAMMKAMQPRTPGFGDYFVGAIQALTPVAAYGFSSWATGKAWNKFAGAYEQYLDQCRTIGIPCNSPEAVLYGGGASFMGGYPGMGMQPGFQNGFQNGPQGFGFNGGNFGFFGPNGLTPGNVGMGPGMFGAGMPGGFTSGFYNTGSYGLDRGWGIGAFPMGIGYNSAAYPFGPVGSFPNGQNQAMYGASMQSYMAGSQYAMGADFTAIGAQQTLMEAQRRYYETVYSAWNQGMAGFQNQAGPFAPRFP